jgi:hypothetical protein
VTTRDAVRAAVDEAVDELFAGAPRRGREPIADATVRWAINVIDRTPLLAALARWRAQDQRAPGGAPTTFPIRALLVALVVLAVLHEPLLMLSVRDVLFRRISDAMQVELGVPEPPGPLDRRGWKATYRNVRTRFHSMLRLMDPSTLPKNRRLTPEEFDRRSREIGADVDPTTQAERHDRLVWFANTIIQASIDQLPRAVRRQWQGHVAIDATPVRAFARGERRDFTSADGSVLRHSCDPDADWYIRTPDDRDGDDPWTVSPTKRLFGYEVALVVMGAATATEGGTFPTLVVGMSALDKPNRRIGPNAIDALASISERGHPSGLAAADRAYNNCVPDNFQLPLRALGYDGVWDYRANQLGIQDSYAGALQVEGNWYCPHMPQDLINATSDFRAGRIDEATLRRRITARGPYRFRPKADPDTEGHQRLMCPAAGGAPTARCDLKPSSIDKKTAGRTRIFPASTDPTQPPPVCLQGSVTFPPAAGAKQQQKLQYATDEWQQAYSTLRNTIEGFNGTVKDGSHSALSDPQRRRVRGVAAQTVFTALLIFATNVQKIDNFNELAVVDFDGVLRRPRRRKTKPLTMWRPRSTPSGHGPPTTAS